MVDIYNEIIIQKVQLGYTDLELDDDDNNPVLDNIITKFNLNRDFAGIRANIVLELYTKIYDKINHFG